MKQTFVDPLDKKMGMSLCQHSFPFIKLVFLWDTDLHRWRRYFLKDPVNLRPDFCTIKVDLRLIDIFPYHALDQQPEQKAAGPTLFRSSSTSL